jgi:hypothetical protein
LQISVAPGRIALFVSSQSSLFGTYLTPLIVGGPVVLVTLWVGSPNVSASASR